MPDDCRCYLRVEDVLRHHAGQPIKDVEVVFAGVHHLEHGGIGNERKERIQFLDFERVDHRLHPRSRHLDETEFREQSVLGDELGVERELAGGSQVRYQLVEPLLIPDDPDVADPVG